MHGASLEPATETSLSFVALLHDLPYVIVEDHPNIRPDSDRDPPGTESRTRTQDRADEADLYRSTVLPLLDYSHRPRPVPVRCFICSHCELSDYRLVSWTTTVVVTASTVSPLASEGSHSLDCQLVASVGHRSLD